MEPYAGPAALFIACVASGIVVPMPEDVSILVAGWQVGDGHLDPGPTAAAAYLGTLGRDALAYTAGRVVGERLDESRFARRLGLGRLSRLRARYEARAERLLFLARFAIGVRSLLYFVSGTLGVPARRFLVTDGLGLLLTTPLLLWLGARYGADASAWLAGVLVHQRWMLAGLLAVGAGAWWWRRSFRSA